MRPSNRYEEENELYSEKLANLIKELQSEFEVPFALDTENGKIHIKNEKPIILKNYTIKGLKNLVEVRGNSSNENGCYISINVTTPSQNKKNVSRSSATVRAKT